jgi:hypothetical protein
MTDGETVNLIEATTTVTRSDGKIMWFICEYEVHNYTIKQTFKNKKNDAEDIES